MESKCPECNDQWPGIDGCPECGKSGGVRAFEVKELATPTAPMTEAEIAELEAIERKATPALWYATDGVPYGFDDEWDVTGDDNCGIASMAGTAEAAKHPRDKQANAELIAAARNAVPRLLATIRALQDDVARLTRKREEANGCPCKYGDPCSYACTCANGVMSGGCLRCCRYGSLTQRRENATWMIQREKDFDAMLADRDALAARVRELVEAKR